MFTSYMCKAISWQHCTIWAKECCSKTRCRMEVRSWLMPYGSQIMTRCRTEVRSWLMRWQAFEGRRYWHLHICNCRPYLLISTCRPISELWKVCLLPVSLASLIALPYNFEFAPAAILEAHLWHIHIMLHPQSACYYLKTYQISNPVMYLHWSSCICASAPK